MMYEVKSGVEFGGLKDVYMKVEVKVKRKRKGMWGGKKSVFESLREYKIRMNGVEKME